MLDALVASIFRFVFVEGKAEVKTEADFFKRLEEKQHLIETMNRAAGLIAKILQLSLEVENRLAQSGTKTTQYAIDDVRSQLNNLLEQGFLASTTLDWLEQFPRYLQGMLSRLDKMGETRDKDIASTEIIARYWAMYASRLGEWEIDAPNIGKLNEFRWLIEELRVSLFAQRLGTRVPISEKRIQKAWDKLAERA